MEGSQPQTVAHRVVDLRGRSVERKGERIWTSRVDRRVWPGSSNVHSIDCLLYLQYAKPRVVAIDRRTR